MNLLQQLQATSFSKPEKPRPKNWARATERAHQQHTEKAIARYRSVMEHKGWLTQSQIEQSLGYAATVSTAFLNKLHKVHNAIEKRNRNNALKYNKKAGYEWRWKNGTEL